MRLSWLAAVAAGALVAVPACAAGDDATRTPLGPLDGAATAAQPAAAGPAPLCEALPGDIVAAATGRSPVSVDGTGTQCSWRAPSTTDGTDVVLQGSFIDTRSFEVGRPAAGATTVPHLGDDAYLVHVGDDAPTTLYVRDGHRAFALWLRHPAGEPEGALTQLARQVLAG
jgi:hypothetical protein